MQYTEVMIRYGELSTKGKNKKYFINRLGQNVRNALIEYKQLEVKWQRDRMHVELNGDDSEAVIERLKQVFGIQTMSPVLKVEKSLEAAKEAVVEMVKAQYTEGASFKINTRRADHDWDYDTNDLNQLLGSAVVEAIPSIKVQMKKPDIKVRVEVRLDGIYLSVETINGAGGMPVGTAGKGMLMLSGGIDSPVAGYLSMKRGIDVEAVHFHSPPYTSPQALQKAKDLAEKLTRYSGSVQFIEVPFTEIQEEIKNKIPEGYIMTVTRRMMLRLTDIIREKRKGLAIMNGESLGQVASQTMESMLAINDVTTTPIIRPLVSMDKNEIIDIAHTIDTFDLSVLPYEDCCTIFTPPKPKTRPSLEKVREYEKAMDVEGLIERALAGLKVERIKPGSTQTEQQKESFQELL
jgi:thiamine biosynthesis protein ThiI